jgi:hypothetical protein
MREFNDLFSEWFSGLSESDQLSVYNEYAYNSGHEPVSYMEEFDEVCNGMRPIDVACKVRYGDFCPHHDYFTFDGYANFESIEFLASWLEDYVDDLADWFEDRQRDLVDLMGVEVMDLYEDEDDEETEPEEENEDEGIKLGDKFQIWGSVYKVLTIDEESRSCGLIREGTTAETLGEIGATIRATFDELLSGSQYFSRMF